MPHESSAPYIGFHVRAGFDVSSDCEITAKEVETCYFNLSDDYIRRSVAALDVKWFVAQSRNTVPLYMIVGLKIAKGASVGQGRDKAMGASAAVMTLGTGMDVGPKVSGSKAQTERESFQDSSDFVLALRLERIRFKRNGGSLYVRDHGLSTKGANMMDGDDASDSITYEYDGIDEGAAELPGQRVCSEAQSDIKDDDSVAVRALYFQ